MPFSNLLVLEIRVQVEKMRQAALQHTRRESIYTSAKSKTYYRYLSFGWPLQKRLVLSSCCRFYQRKRALALTVNVLCERIVVCTKLDLL